MPFSHLIIIVLITSFTDEILAIETAWELTTGSSKSSRKGKQLKPIPQVILSDTESDTDAASSSKKKKKKRTRSSTKSKEDTGAPPPPSKDEINDTSASEDEEEVIDTPQASTSTVIGYLIPRPGLNNSLRVTSKAQLHPKVKPLEHEIANLIPERYHLAVLAERPPNRLTPQEIQDLYENEKNYEDAKAHGFAFARGMLHKTKVAHLVPNWSEFYDDANLLPAKSHRTKSAGSKSGPTLSSKDQSGTKRKVPSSTKALSPPKKRHESVGSGTPPTIVMSKYNLSNYSSLMSEISNLLDCNFSFCSPFL